MIYSVKYKKLQKELLRKYCLVLKLLIQMINRQAENRFMRQDNPRILNRLFLHEFRQSLIATAPGSYIGWATVVNNGRTIEAIRMLSTLIMEKSSGTFRPSS